MASLKNTTINDTGFIQMPSGTMAQRPASPVAGMLRYNTTTAYLEFYSGVSWQLIAGTGTIAAAANCTLYLDAGLSTSYPGTGTTWTDLSGNNNNFTIQNSSTWAYDGTNKCFNMSGSGGISGPNMMSSTNNTCVFIMKTTDNQSLFWGSTGGSAYYLGAYSSGDQYYNGSVSVSSGLYMNTASIPNLYSYIRTGNWMMLEFKGVDFSSAWPAPLQFNQYSGFTFDNGSMAAILVYNKVLSASESNQNKNYFGGRYGF